MKKWVRIRGFVFVLLLFITLVIPRTVSKGIFLDGLTYSSISRNLAEGVGTFWSPYYTETVYKVFHELLPLGFYLQSFWFRIFGDKIWIEKAYGITVTLLAILFFMLTLWSLENLGQDNDLPGSRSTRICWSGFLLVVTPVIAYSARNNLLETTVVFFVFLATFSAVRSFSSKTPFCWSVLSGLFVMAAFLSKSIPGIFPLVIYPAVGIIFRKPGWFRRWCYQISVVLGLLIAIFIFSNDGKTAILDHLRQQVVASVAGKREVAESKLALGKCFLQEFSVPLAFSLLLCGVKKWRFGRTQKFLLIVGLAGFLPLLLSPKQARRYLIPSLPFFAGALGYCSAGGIEKLKNKKIGQLFKRVAIPLLVTTCIVSGLVERGKIHKNKKQWKEVLPVWEELQVYKKRALVEPCGFTPGWTDHAFYQRYFKWSFGPGPYILQRKDIPCNLPSNIEVVIDAPKIKLWVSKNYSHES